MIQPVPSLRALRGPIHAHPYLGIDLFIGVLVLITIFPVLSSLPLLPVAGTVWGLGSAMAHGSVLVFVGYSLGIVAVLGVSYLGLWRRRKK